MAETPSTDGPTESLLAGIRHAERWIAPVPARVRWQAGLTTLLSYGIVAYSVGWNLRHPLMLSLYGISAAALLVPVWLRQRADRRVQSLLDQQVSTGRAIDQALGAGQLEED